MSLQAEHELEQSPGDWVTIVHPETGGMHTCVREAFEDVYSNKGWVLALDAQDPDEQAPPEDSSVESDQGDDAPDGEVS